MTISAEHIRDTIGDYLTTYPQDRKGLGCVFDLLDSGVDLSARTEFRGHATAGAVLTDPRGQVLHIRHVALDRWLLPGGHLEADDIRLIDAARRELTEETGISASAVAPVNPYPVQIDIHPIPANNAKNEPAHQHIDFRFLFRTSADVGELQTEEITDAAWRGINAIADEVLRGRISGAICR